MNKQNPSNQTIPLKKRRGGQPGNRNSAGNRGNQNARGFRGNRGGFGASAGNQNARKKRTLETELIREYADNPQILAWIKANREVLSVVELRSDVALDQAMFKGLPLAE